MIATLISGLNPTKDKNGLADISQAISKLNINTVGYGWDFPGEIPQSDIFIVHSFGSRRLMLELAKGYSVKYVAMIDPVGNWFPLNFPEYWKKFEIPLTVTRADCFQRSFPLFPPSGEIKNESASFRNYKNINCSHADAPRNSFIVSTILQSIGEISG